jgi:predicted membrane channel-forming protein YqfA (hemolysin III family)
MYSLVLLVHSWLRWAVLAAGLAAIARGGSHNETAGRWFTILLDVQMLLGLLLYFVLSPVTRAALQDFGGAMGAPQMRFYAVEHLFGMVIAIALAHVGLKKVRKAPVERKARTAAIFYGLALVAILISIPWPGLPAGRPLFRLTN